MQVDADLASAGSEPRDWGHRLGGGGLLGHLIRNGEIPCAMSLSVRTGDGVHWIAGDLGQPGRLQIPAIATQYCTADAKLLARSLHRFLDPAVKRVVVVSSTRC